MCPLLPVSADALCEVGGVLRTSSAMFEGTHFSHVQGCISYLAVLAHSPCFLPLYLWAFFHHRFPFLLVLFVRAPLGVQAAALHILPRITSFSHSSWHAGCLSSHSSTCHGILTLLRARGLPLFTSWLCLAGFLAIPLALRLPLLTWWHPNPS